jgi:hypothetical protein
MTDRFPFVPPAPRPDFIVDPGVPTPAPGVVSGQHFALVRIQDFPAFSIAPGVVGKTAALERFQFFHASIPECHPMARCVRNREGTL